MNQNNAQGSSYHFGEPASILLRLVWRNAFPGRCRPASRFRFWPTGPFGRYGGRRFWVGGSRGRDCWIRVVQGQMNLIFPAAYRTGKTFELQIGTDFVKGKELVSAAWSRF